MSIRGKLHLVFSWHTILRQVVDQVYFTMFLAESDRLPTDFHPSVLGNNKLLTTMSPHKYQETKQVHNDSACGSFRLVSQSSGMSQMTDCCLLMCFRFGLENLHLVLFVPAKNPCSHTSLWSSLRQPERDANLGVESEIVQPGHSCASKQSGHRDTSWADGFWISLFGAGKSLVPHWAV